MMKFDEQPASIKRVRIATSVLVIFCSGALASAQPAWAQAAGGSQAGVGAPVVNNAGPTLPPIEPPQCVHRSKDLRRGGSIDDNLLSTWLSVRQPAVAVIAANGSASGLSTGTFAITVTSNGIPVASSQQVRGTGAAYSHTSASLNLVPGRQYKITAKAMASNKRLDLFDMYVGIGRTCP
jgi:hypothetical protein